MLKIATGRSTTGTRAITIVLGAHDVFMDEEGNPCPGVAIKPTIAREAAYLLLLYAEQLDREAAEES
jgi:hypothetical protein